MIFKPSEETPLSALRLAEILVRLGCSREVFNVVQGDYRVGQMLTAHDDIAKALLVSVVRVNRSCLIVREH